MLGIAAGQSIPPGQMFSKRREPPSHEARSADVRGVERVLVFVLVVAQLVLVLVLVLVLSESRAAAAS